MAIQETTPPRYIVVGYRELAALAVTILVIAGAIMGAMQWAVVTAVTPLREEIRREMTSVRTELTAVRNEMTNLRKEISDLSNRVARIETILEQQRQGTMAPDTP